METSKTSQFNVEYDAIETKCEALALENDYNITALAAKARTMDVKWFDNVESSRLRQGHESDLYTSRAREYERKADAYLGALMLSREKVELPPTKDARLNRPNADNQIVTIKNWLKSLARFGRKD